MPVYFTPSTECLSSHHEKKSLKILKCCPPFRHTCASNTGVLPKSLSVLSTEPVLRQAAADRGLRFSTEQYGCRQSNDFIKFAEDVLF